ncbi:MAG: hypothetical protein VW945_07410 [Candidatus Poseidoniales archaeon]
MAGGASSSSNDEALPPWYPAALLDRPLEPSTLVSGLPSPWGRVHGWDYTAALSPNWWGSEANGRWGSWPNNVNAIEVIGQHRWGVEVHLNGEWVAHLYPFQTGRDVSALALHEPWARALADAPLVLPVAGQYNERGDCVAVFPMHTLRATAETVRQPVELAATAARVHAALAAESTPNTERRWNEQLKALEDKLKTTTLWRAPHTKHVVGLPSTNISMDGFADMNGSAVLIPFPRPLIDHLIAPDERLPGVANMAMMEQRLSLAAIFDDTTGRANFYRAWGDIVPDGWTSKASFSTVNGGVWIWRYHAMLLMLAEARAYGLSTQAQRCDRWLLDVSRIQARLGELRTVHAVRRGGALAAIAAALIGSGPVQVPFILGSAGVALAAHIVHQRRMPPSL